MYPSANAAMKKNTLSSRNPMFSQLIHPELADRQDCGDTVKKREMKSSRHFSSFQEWRKFQKRNARPIFMKMKRKKFTKIPIFAARMQLFCLPVGVSAPVSFPEPGLVNITNFN